jgi:ferredoxin
MLAGAIGAALLGKATLCEVTGSLNLKITTDTLTAQANTSSVVDSDKCVGCGKCVAQCPKKALELVTEFIDLEDKTVAAVTENHRKKSVTPAQAATPNRPHPLRFIVSQRCINLQLEIII